MILWEKVHQVKVKKIKQQVIKPVEGAENIHFTDVSVFVRVVVLEGLLNFDSQVGEIDIGLSMEIKVFINEIIFLNQLLLLT